MFEFLLCLGLCSGGELAAELDPVRTGAIHGLSIYVPNFWKIPGMAFCCNVICKLLTWGSAAYLVFRNGWPWGIFWLCVAIVGSLWLPKFAVGERRKNDDNYQVRLLYAFFKSYFEDFPERLRRGLEEQAHLGGGSEITTLTAQKKVDMAFRILPPIARPSDKDVEMLAEKFDLSAVEDITDEFFMALAKLMRSKRVCIVVQKDLSWKPMYVVDYRQPEEEWRKLNALNAKARSLKFLARNSFESSSGASKPDPSPKIANDEDPKIPADLKVLELHSNDDEGTFVDDTLDDLDHITQLSRVLWNEIRNFVSTQEAEAVKQALGDAEFREQFAELDEEKGECLLKGYFAVQALLPFQELLRLTPTEIQMTISGMFMSGEPAVRASVWSLADQAHEKGVRIRGRVSDRTLLSSVLSPTK